MHNAALTRSPVPTVSRAELSRKQPRTPPKRIAVLGAPRSGTKFVADVLASHGVMLDHVGWANEHYVGHLINDTILARHYAMDMIRYPYGKLPPEELSIREDHWKLLRTIFIEYMDLRAAAEDASAWAFKDVRLTILHELWLERFDAVVALYREPAASVTSFVEMGWTVADCAVETAEQYWLRFNRSLLHIVDSYRDRVALFLLEYIPDVDTMGDQLGQLADALGLGGLGGGRVEFRPRRSPALAGSTAFSRRSDVVAVLERLRASQAALGGARGSRAVCEARGSVILSSGTRVEKGG